MTGVTHTSEPHTRLFLYSLPRTRSNLLIRLLETHPQVMTRQYPFMFGAILGPEGWWPEERKIKMMKASGEPKEEFEERFAKLTYQSGLDDVEKLLASAEEKGKFSVIKEHALYLFDSKFLNSNITVPSPEVPRPVIVDHKLDVVGSEEIEFNLPSPPFPNPTLLPDRIVATVSPVIIIRHPMFTYPSYARISALYEGTVFDDDFAVNSTYRWQRVVYDFYRAYYDKVDPEGKKDWPIVVDGDKLVEDPQGQMKKLCALIGWDESQIQYSWNASNHPVKNKVINAFVGTAMKSTGVIKGSETVSTPTLEEEVKKWTEEWNEEVAQQMKESVNSSMADYEYLLKQSL